MDDGERQPWVRQEDEPGYWFRRFDFARLHNLRTVLAAFSGWKEQESREVTRSHARNAPRAWYRRAQTWRWEERWSAWDQYLSDQTAAEIETAWKARLMGPNEVLGRLAEQGRGDLGRFFKLSERWTEAPLPSEEVLEEEKFVKVVNNAPVEATRYRVRKVVLDLEAFQDPERSRLVKKFADSPKNGLSIELHGAQPALVDIGRHHKLFTDQVELPGGIDVRQIPDEQHDRALSTLALALGALLSGAGPGRDGALEPAEPSPMAGAPESGG